MPKYGSAAQDLYYFLISSPELNIKIEQFDYCIRLYYGKLKESLGILKYTGPIPSLREFHMEILRNGVWGKMH